MSDILFYVSLMGGVLFALYAITAATVGWNPKTVMAHLKSNGASGGIKAVIIASILLGIILTVAYNKASASDEFRYLTHTTVFAGLDYDVKSTPVFCYQGDVNDRLTSNVGIKQHLIGRGGIDILAQYTHHSCALNKDKPTYDAVGVMIEWTFKR